MGWLDKPQLWVTAWRWGRPYRCRAEAGFRTPESTHVLLWQFWLISSVDTYGTMAWFASMVPAEWRHHTLNDGQQNASVYGRT